MANKPKAAEIIALGGSYRLAGKSSGVNERTVRRWMQKDQDFQDQVKAIRSEAFNGILGSLSGIAQRALGVLNNVVNDPDADINSKIRASNYVLNHLRGMRKEIEVEAKVDELESVLRGSGFIS